VRIGAVGLSSAAPPTRPPRRGSRDDPVAYGLLAPWLLGIVFRTIGSSRPADPPDQGGGRDGAAGAAHVPGRPVGSGFEGMLAMSVFSPIPLLLIFLAGRRRLLRGIRTTGIG